MTYPPQQPGPGGWDRSPAGNPADGAPTPGGPPPQQQPNFYGNQHAGWPQGPITGVPAQPGQQPFPPAAGQDPFGGRQFGQQVPPPPNWGGEFGAGAWIQEPGEFDDDEPERRSPLVWILGGVGVLVLAGAVVGGIFLFGGGDPGAARPVAQGLVDKVNAGDFGSLGPQLCAANRGELDTQFQQLASGEFQVQLGQITEQGEQARAKLHGTYTLGGATMPVDQTILLTVEDDEWKVCKLDQ
ncbi:hypothetical protein [Saccharopolyspora gloriosae]|uniref:Rv0361 family membrane protein n=1 Tax=Saccharopolyspora gloriosae TaxID=455344 RepID=UPI001FB7853B|nr:hypothetical protein [Saccharopolyspora gloriosae]